MRPSPRRKDAPRTSAIGFRAVLPRPAPRPRRARRRRRGPWHAWCGRRRRACRAGRRAAAGRTRRSRRRRCRTATAARSCPTRSPGGRDRDARGSRRGWRPPSASGSRGSSVTTSPERGPTFDASMPPLAHTNPCAVSVMMTPFSIRTTRFASRSTTSTWRASRSWRRAHSIATGPGSTVVRSTMAPSAFDDDLLGDDEHVVVAERQMTRVAASASAMSVGRSSPGTISPIPSIGTTSTRSATDRLGRLGLGEQQVLGRIDVERQRTVEQLDASARPSDRPRGGRPCCRRRTGSR